MAEITALEALGILDDAREIYNCMNDKENLAEFPYAGDTITIQQADIDAAKTRINTALAAFQTRVAAVTSLV